MLGLKGNVEAGAGKIFGECPGSAAAAGLAAVGAGWQPEYDQVGIELGGGGDDARHCFCAPGTPNDTDWRRDTGVGVAQGDTEPFAAGVDREHTHGSIVRGTDYNDRGSSAGAAIGPTRAERSW